MYLSKQEGSRQIDSKKQNIHPMHIFLTSQNPVLYKYLLLLILISLNKERSKELQVLITEINQQIILDIQTVCLVVNLAIVQ